MGPTSVIMGAGLGQDVALMTDGRFSGASHVGDVNPPMSPKLVFLRICT